METTKSPFLSLGFWGGLGATVLAVAPFVAKMVGLDPAALNGDLAHIGEGIMAALALYGRLKATHVLKF